MKTNKKQSGIIWAVALILTGLVILLSSFEVITINNNLYFYVAIAAIGVIFHVTCFLSKPKRYNYLVPGGMFLIIAALFITFEYTDAVSINELWPVIILSAAFGMLEQKVFSRGEQGNWVSIIIISIVGFFFLIQTNLKFGIVFGILLILIGVLIVVRMSRNLPQVDDKPGEAPKIDTPPEPEPQVDEFDEL